MSQLDTTKTIKDGFASRAWQTRTADWGIANPGAVYGSAGGRPTMQQRIKKRRIPEIIIPTRLPRSKIPSTCSSQNSINVSSDFAMKKGNIPGTFPKSEVSSWRTTDLRHDVLPRLLAIYVEGHVQHP